MGSAVTTLRNASLLLLHMIPEASSMAASKMIDVRSMPRAEGGSRRRRSSINIEFGGDVHGFNNGGEGYLIRPEAVKSHACTANGCSDCNSRKKCWHGSTEDDGFGYIVLNLQGGSHFTHYEAEVWARCPSGSESAEWWLEDKPDWRDNGVLELYAGSTKLVMGERWTVVQKGGETNRIRIIWRPNNMAQASHVKVWLEAYKVDPNVDECMAVKDCLEILGDGTDAAFKLRNNNKMQLKCLTDPSSMSAGKNWTWDKENSLKIKCEEWDNCLTTSKKKIFLRSLLGAALKPKPVLLEEVSHANENRSQLVDAENCNHPENDDPETWDCECVEEMTTACDQDDPETCIKALLCNNPNVCSSWVADHCPADLMEQRRQESSKAASTAQLHNGLDNAVQGKCSQ